MMPYTTPLTPEKIINSSLNENLLYLMPISNELRKIKRKQVTEAKLHISL